MVSMGLESKMAPSKLHSLQGQSLRRRLRLCLSRQVRERKKMNSGNNTSIYELVRTLEEAWNNSNSDRFASVFAEDADFITVLGTHYNGRGSVETGHRRIFDTIFKNSHNRYSIAGVRFVRPDVVVVFVQARLSLQDGRTITARPTMLLTRENGKWQVAVLQNTAVAEPGASPLELAKLP
jgi:uncharacterized protein (TIGR02246 family)